MDQKEIYEFDRSGYLVIRNMLTPDEVKSLAAAIDEIELDAVATVSPPLTRTAPWGVPYNRNTQRGYNVHGGKGQGKSLIVEDFWNASAAFDVLLQHEKTNGYIGNVIQGRYTINNCELRYRYPGSTSSTHMGGPIDHKYRYAFSGGKIDCMMVRMIYFVHDVTADHGAFCVVPGTHKSSLHAPYPNDFPEDEPNMIALAVRAGDAILFTENLRHGGFVNRAAGTRKTIHVGYGPYWMMSQNICTMEEPPYITEATKARISKQQLALFQTWPDKSN